MTAFAQKVLTDLPAPNVTGLAASSRSNNYVALPLDRNYNDKFDGKIDGQMKETMYGFVRLSQRKVNIFNEPNIPGPSGGNSNGFTRVLNQQASAGYTWYSRHSRCWRHASAFRARSQARFPLPSGDPACCRSTASPDCQLPHLTGGLTSTTISGWTHYAARLPIRSFRIP